MYTKKISGNTLSTLFFLLCIALALSVPVFSPFLIEGHDLDFHLVRIEELKFALYNFQIPSRIQGDWLNKAGYAVSVFYGELFLYFPAFLRLLGFSVNFSYNSYIIFINLLTVLVAYYCFFKIYHSPKIAILSTILYSGSYYRLTNIYVRSAVGEYTAMSFYPLVALGLYQILLADTKQKEYKQNCLPLALGFSGLIQSHILSCEIAAFFTLLTVLICIKRTLEPARFFSFLKAVFITILLNAGFLIPFLDYMQGEYIFNDPSIQRAIQSKGLFLSDLFNPFPTIGGSAITPSARLAGETQITASIGIGITLVYLITIYLLFVHHSRFSKTTKKELLFYAILLSVSMWMVTCHFPWDYLYKFGGIFCLLIQSLQFPWRITGIITLLGALCCGFTVTLLKEHISFQYGKDTFYTIVLCTFISIFWFTGNLLNNCQYVNYDSHNLRYSSVSGGEYLPRDTDATYILEFSYNVPKNMKFEELEHTSGSVTISCTNVSNDFLNIEVPLLYYPYYTAEDTNTKIHLTLSKSSNNMIIVTIPPDYSGVFTVHFQEPLFWKLSSFISFCTFIIIVIQCFKILK